MSDVGVREKKREREKGSRQDHSGRSAGRRSLTPVDLKVAISRP
jgi:hypothetical protein